MAEKQQAQAKAQKPEPTRQTAAAEAAQPGPELLPAGLSQVGALNALPAHTTAHSLRQSSMLRLQRQIGNTVAQRRLVQRQDMDAGVEPQPRDADVPAGVPESTPELARPTFSQTEYSQEGSRFDSLYVPDGPAPTVGTLSINLWVHITYQPFTRAMMRQEPFRAHRFTPEQRADFAWTTAEQEKFESDFMSSVHDGWSDKHSLHLDEPDFAEYRSRVEVNVLVVSDPGSAHMRITAQKIPRGVPRPSSFVRGNEATLHSPDPSEPVTLTDERADYIRQVKPFDFDSAAITPGIESQLREIEDDIRPMLSTSPDDIANFSSITFTGRASSEGPTGYNERLAMQRAEAVSGRMSADMGSAWNAFSFIESQGEIHATTDPNFRRVDIQFDSRIRSDSTTTQNVAAHEAGHMFGLGDEYIEEVPEEASATPRFLADQPQHYGDVESLMGTEAADDLLVQNSSSIMAHGSEVRRGHYVYFLQAINQMTGKDWEVE
jgi:hypothetical protein